MMRWLSERILEPISSSKKICLVSLVAQLSWIVGEFWIVLTGRRLRFLGRAFSVTFCGSIEQAAASQWGGWNPPKLETGAWLVNS